MGFGAIIFGITFWLIVDDARKRRAQARFQEKWEGTRLKSYYERFPHMKEIAKKYRVD